MTALLTADALTVGYRGRRGAPRTLLHIAHLAVMAGSLVAVLGRNGSGKSTLLRTLAGLHPPLTGTLTVAGHDITRLAARDRARTIAVVLTGQPVSGDLRAAEVVALGRQPYTDWTGTLRPTDHAAIATALAAVGATALAPRRIYQLSDGERQRVWLARALAQQPRLLLLDEPTAFLDLPGRLELAALLRHLAHDSNRALIFSTHELDLALRVADRLWLLPGDGTLIQDTPAGMLAAGHLAQLGYPGTAYDHPHRPPTP